VCVCLNPNWSSRRIPQPLTSFRILVSTFFPNSLPIVSNRLLGRYDKGWAGFFPRFRVEITLACFHGGGKHCTQRIALNNQLNDCWFRRIIYRMKLSVQSVSQGFIVLGVRDNSSTGMTRGSDGVGILDHTSRHLPK